MHIDTIVRYRPRGFYCHHSPLPPSLDLRPLAPLSCPQVAAQPEEAIELYMAADRPRQALAILNQQLSSAMDRGVAEAVSGMDVSGAGECIHRVLRVAVYADKSRR